MDRNAQTCDGVLGIDHPWRGNTCHVVAFQHHVSDLDEKDARALRRSPVVGTVESELRVAASKILIKSAMRGVDVDVGSFDRASVGRFDSIIICPSG
jgi:hypothetical protein